MYTPGGMSQTTADGLYVNVPGDTMTGDLIMNDATDVTPRVQFDAVDGSDTLLGLFEGSVLDGVSAVLTVEADWSTGGSTFVSSVTLEPRSTADGRSVIRHGGHCVPEDNDIFDLGEPTHNERWRDLYLTRNMIDGAGVSLTIANAKAAYDHSQDNTQAHSDYLLNNAADVFGGTLTPSSDEAFDLGDTTNGLRQIVFSDASTGSNRAKFRGNKCIGHAGADIYWGIDDVSPGYFVQKTVVPGSTATTNADDYTNLYQGDGGYKFVALMYEIPQATFDGSTGKPTNGVVIGDGTYATIGPPLVFKGGGSRAFFMYLSESGNKMVMGPGTVAGARVQQLEIGLRGTTPAILPDVDNAINLGSSTLEWKDAWFDGTATIDICKVDEQLIVPSGTADPASTVGSLFLRTDLGTNGILQMYANGAWRAVAVLA